jgi:Mn2+/Fe2+ NRAMP family transporter
MPEDNDAKPRGSLRAIGPAIITASVVLGPGSILSASKIGYQYGYQMAWVLALAVFMMIGITALSARLGVLLEGTLCEELSRRVGRWAAVVTGVALFLIAACFQFGNNTGVVASLEPFVASDQSWKAASIGLIVVLNLVVVIALFGFRQLYLPVERLMKFLVTCMIIGFASNLVMARPDILQLAKGLVPQLPAGSEATLLPKIERPPDTADASVTPGRPKIVDHLTPVTALFATTFSIGGAFYQAYLVRKKGWTSQQLQQGLVDSTVGICVLGLVTLMVMVTAAAVLHDNPAVSEPRSAADVARQLEPFFGPAAQALFCMGIFAGAFSSFLVNAMIGGTVLSDGLGLGGDIDRFWPKLFTVVVLLTGMLVAIGVLWTDEAPVNLIIFAQAITVLGLPALALALLILALQRDYVAKHTIPRWLKAVAVVALLVVSFLAIRTAATLYLKMTIQ